MTRRLLACVLVPLGLLLGCDSLPGKPDAAHRHLRPDEVKDVATLYDRNCAGCHGADGTFGPALPLAHPAYLALVDDLTLEWVVSSGVPGTSMPGFARSEGGTLTDEQVHILVTGIRKRWGRPDALGDTKPPPYSADGEGDPKLGATVFADLCASCHGAEGKGGPKVGSIVDRSYLALVSPQALRSLVIAGRPDLGHPDWRGYGKEGPMTAKQVSDVVAWLVAQR